MLTAKEKHKINLIISVMEDKRESNTGKTIFLVLSQREILKTSLMVRKNIN